MRTMSGVAWHMATQTSCAMHCDQDQIWARQGSRQSMLEIPRISIAAPVCAMQACQSMCLALEARSDVMAVQQQSKLQVHLIGL